MYLKLDCYGIYCPVSYTHLDVYKRQAKDCSVGMQQRLEILKILYQNADIIILDEPTAVLTPPEVEELLKTMRHLASLGKSIIFITHKLQEVMEVSDRIMVMRAGECIQTIPTSETNIEELSFMMVGRRVLKRTVSTKISGKTVMNMKNVCARNADGSMALNGINLHVDQGEIVGIAGVSGNGQSELAGCILGLNRTEQGSIQLCGREITGLQVCDIRKQGCACIPEDRYRYGCAAMGDLVETAMMGKQYRTEFSKKGILNKQKLRQYATELLNKYNVRYKGLDQKAGELSGGNLQKIIVAREVAHNTPFLIAAEPTRGVDIGAMEFIHNTLLEKRKGGGAILLISSELSEIMELSDRIYVIYGGLIAGEFQKHEATEEKLGLLMMGGAVDEKV